MSLAAGALVGCAEAYDDTEIKNKIEELEDRTAALRDLCDRVNTGITLVSRLEEARQLNRKVTQVVENRDEAGKVTGYAVSFTAGSDLTIECPADGKDGYVGKPGEDAQAPSIGVVQHDGKDCWTIGGELVRDEEGNPVPLYAYEGGEKTDGRTPQMKVEEGRWYYRLAETDQWTPVAVSVIYGDGNLFASVQEDGDNVVFNLSAGGSLTLKKVKFFSMRLETLSASVKAGNDIEISYFLTADDTQIEVEAFAPAGWAVTVSEGKILVSAPADAAAGTSVQVVVFATGSDGESVYQVLNITVEEA